MFTYPVTNNNDLLHILKIASRIFFWNICSQQRLKFIRNWNCFGNLSFIYLLLVIYEDVELVCVCAHVGVWVCAEHGGTVYEHESSLYQGDGNKTERWGKGMMKDGKCGGLAPWCTWVSAAVGRSSVLSLSSLTSSHFLFIFWVRVSVVHCCVTNGASVIMDEWMACQWRATRRFWCHHKMWIPAWSHTPGATCHSRYLASSATRMTKREIYACWHRQVVACWGWGSHVQVNYVSPLLGDCNSLMLALFLL